MIQAATNLEMSKEIDRRDSVKVVTSNKFISAQGLEALSTKARKLLYIAIAQCRKDDVAFEEHVITCAEFAEMTGVKVQAIYKEIQKVTDELLEIKLTAKNDKEETFIKYNMFSYCSKSPGNGVIKFKLNSDMAPFLLGLKNEFSQPLLSDFIRMKSTYSMAIWHMMQREMRSRKPIPGKSITFDISIEEIRAETGTQDKFLQINDLKRYVLLPAIKEIEENCDVKINMGYIKKGKRVVGFHCIATSVYDFLAKRVEKKQSQSETYLKVESDPHEEELLKTYTSKDGQIMLYLG